MVALGSVADSSPGSTATTPGGSAMEKSDQDFPETYTFMTKNSVLLPGHPAPNYGAHQNQSQDLTARVLNPFIPGSRRWTNYRLAFRLAATTASYAARCTVHGRGARSS